MSESLHHVPGRIRIRARLFRSESRERSQALRRIQLPLAAVPRPIAAEIGKVAFNMLVNKGVSYSLSTLLRTRF